MTIHRIVLILWAAGLTLVPAASASHLAMPESALFHNGEIYVSLIGDPENNDGAVVTVDSTGKVTGTLVRASRAKRLVDPTGMVVTGSTLWVNDVTRIRSYDVRTGAAGRVVAIPRSVFINDLAADRRGNLWASDSETQPPPRERSGLRYTFPPAGELWGLAQRRRAAPERRHLVCDVQ
jgi:hypothetical protein